jgi:DNA-binding CsgD family transcriptional regulator
MTASMRSPSLLDETCPGCLLLGAIEGLEDGLVLVDVRGRVFHLNPSARTLLGLGDRRVVGAPLRRLLAAPALAAFWASAVQAKGPVAADLPLAPGSGRLVRATVARCRSGSGKPLGRALLLRDVSRESRLRIELPTAVARRLLEMTGAVTEEAPHASLTRRERQVLALLAAGLRNRAIALRLGISPHTVASHLKRLYGKAGVSNRAQAVAFALALRVPPERGSGVDHPPNG